MNPEFSVSFRDIYRFTEAEVYKPRQNSSLCYTLSTQLPCSFNLLPGSHIHSSAPWAAWAWKKDWRVICMRRIRMYDKLQELRIGDHTWITKVNIASCLLPFSLFFCVVFFFTTSNYVNVLLYVDMCHRCLSWRTVRFGTSKASLRW